MLSYASQLPTEDPDLELDDCDELHGGGAIGAGFKSRSQNRSQNRGNRPYVYEQDDEGGDNGSPDVDLQDYYEVGSNSRNGGSKNGAVGADGTDGYNLEMVSAPTCFIYITAFKKSFLFDGLSVHFV